jgi:hypothetical protein
MQIKPIKYLATLALAALSASNSFGVVSLSNPGFEDPTISPWGPEGGASISLSAVNVFSGLQSAKVDFPGADGSGIKQDFAISPADRFQEYTVSFNVLATGFTEHVGVRAGLWEFGPTGIVFNLGDYHWFAPGVNGWTTVTGTFLTTSADADVFRVVAQIAPQGTPKISGSLWVDAASIQTVPEPGTMALGLMGGIGMFAMRRNRRV